MVVQQLHTICMAYSPIQRGTSLTSRKEPAIFVQDLNRLLAAPVNSLPPEPEGLFPIRTVAQLTGANPITLRAWGRRYGLIQPVRTAKGHRLYSAEDIHTIRRILGFLDQGMGIGQVARLLASTGRGGTPSPPPSFMSDYRAALTRLDEAALDRLDAEGLGFTQPDALLLHVLLPLLDELALQQDD